MEIWGTVALFVLGIVLTVKGGDLFVDAPSWIAEVSGIPKFIIGATIVSLATTMPELLVSLLAAAQGKADMAIGNAVGSVTANTGLIMALAFVCMPVTFARKTGWRKAALLLGAMARPVGCQPQRTVWLGRHCTADDDLRPGPVGEPAWHAQGKRSDGKGTGYPAG